MADSQSPVSALNYVTRAYAIQSYYDAGMIKSYQYGLSNSYNYSSVNRYMVSSEWGRITSGFGYRERFHRMHKGIDIAMETGDTVCSPLAGTVDRVGYEAHGYGHYIVMIHDDGMETRYAHLTRPLVSAGMRVNAGDPIAISGNTGNSTGPHLHFETRYNGLAVDPRNFFNFNSNSRNLAYTQWRGMSVANEYVRDSYNAALMHGEAKDADGFSVGKTGSKPGTSALTAKSTYIVREGDTVKTVARRAGLTVLRLCQLNGLSSTSPLTPGSTLRLR